MSPFSVINRIQRTYIAYEVLQEKSIQHLATRVSTIISEFSGLEETGKRNLKSALVLPIVCEIREKLKAGSFPFKIPVETILKSCKDSHGRIRWHKDMSIPTLLIEPAASSFAIRLATASLTPPLIETVSVKPEEL